MILSFTGEQNPVSVSTSSEKPLLNPPGSQITVTQKRQQGKRGPKKNIVVSVPDSRLDSPSPQQVGFFVQ